MTRGRSLPAKTGNAWKQFEYLAGDYDTKYQAASGERGGNPKKPTNNNATESTDDGIASFITPAADGLCAELR